MKPERITVGADSINDVAERLHATAILDTLTEQLEDLFLIRHPRYKFDPEFQEPLRVFVEEKLGGKPSEQYGEWFFFPWNTTLVHILPEDEWQEIRTARNRNLITEEEQKRFYDCKVGVAGLSVGSHVALTLAMMGGAKHMVLADPDVFSSSNLNRVRADVLALGKNKAQTAAQAIYQINPYAVLTILDDGITENNIGKFFDEQGIDILIEETDKLELKISLREEARKRKIPVIMGTDNGDGVILDIERYDLHPELQLFNGVIGDISVEMFKNFPPHELPKLATRIAGPELVVPRMKDSLLEVGRTIYSWPQLGDAAALCGIVIAYAVRRIANGMPTTEGKFEVNLDAVLDPAYTSAETKKAREEHHNEFMKKVGLA
jgi:molybdopterin/thiamine biosynthesis adenylyltransferase